MLAIQKSKTKAQHCTPNLLPCKINHDGPVNASERYWKPETSADGSSSAYFRGRKLEGKSIKLPDGYRGAVLKTTNNVLPVETSQDGDEDEDEDEDVSMETKEIEQLASFDEVMVWGHEATPASDDAYSKGLGEWVSFAEAMHSAADQNESVPNPGK
ncbi:ribonuclease H1 small subunit [Venturia nashicola]|nr:ribonuclease H1 small subunit [Venturia nashicola]